MNLQISEDNGSYLKVLKSALKQKNFRAYLVAFLAQSIMLTILLASLPYYVQYILFADNITFIFLGMVFVVFNFLSIPIWIRIARKYGNRVGYLCGTGITPIILILGMFVSSLLMTIVLLAIIGLCYGAFQMSQPAFSDVIDEIVMETGVRNEGIYYGFRTFFSRFSIVIMAISFGVIHSITNFDPKAKVQEISAQWGIIICMQLIPAISFIIAFFFMWKVYDLKPDKVQSIKNKLKELNL